LKLDHDAVVGVPGVDAVDLGAGELRLVFGDGAVDVPDELLHDWGSFFSGSTGFQTRPHVQPMQ
jgi:hypothetical protein